MSAEYSDAYIGDCISGSCSRPATVRVHENFVLCALHHVMHEVGEEQDDATLTLELVKGWRSQASAHGLDWLELELWRIALNAQSESERADRLREQLKRVDGEDGEFEAGLRTRGSS